MKSRYISTLIARFYLKRIQAKIPGVAVCSFMFVALLGSSVSAQVRTFVASTGVDTNPCSRTAPCRTFQAAVNAAAVGGEVVALDSAGFGSNVIIHKAISIVAPTGVYAGLTVFSGVGMLINAAATDTVILRGLTILNPGGSHAQAGVFFNTGGTLHIENCVVNGFSSGIPDIPSTGVTFGGPGTLEIKDSILRGNDAAVLLEPQQGLAAATIDQVRLEAGSIGLVALDGSKVTVRNSIASANRTGFQAEAHPLATVELNIENCVASNNQFGIVVRSDPGAQGAGIATVRVSNSTVTNNSVFGLEVVGAQAFLLSRGNNTVEGNGADTDGIVETYSPK